MPTSRPHSNLHTLLRGAECQTCEESCRSACAHMFQKERQADILPHGPAYGFGCRQCFCKHPPSAFSGITPHGFPYNSGGVPAFALLLSWGCGEGPAAIRRPGVVHGGVRSFPLHNLGFQPFCVCNKHKNKRCVLLCAGDCIPYCMPFVFRGSFGKRRAHRHVSFPGVQWPIDVVGRLALPHRRLSLLASFLFGWFFSFLCS